MLKKILHIRNCAFARPPKPCKGFSDLNSRRLSFFDSLLISQKSSSALGVRWTIHSVLGLSNFILPFLDFFIDGMPDSFIGDEVAVQEMELTRRPAQWVDVKTFPAVLSQEVVD